MRSTNPLWGSVSILIGVIIAILALLRGPWAMAALIVVFVLWGLWLVWIQLLPAWRANREYRRRERQLHRQQEAASDSGVSLVLLRHVNHRISEHLQSVYPKAYWEWTMSDPAAFVVYGGTGRIRVYGVPDYDFADVTLDRQGSLRCALVKVAPLDGMGPRQTPRTSSRWTPRCGMSSRAAAFWKT